MFKLRLLPWDDGVRNLFRRPTRTALTLGGLTTVSVLLSSIGGLLGIGMGLAFLAFTGFSVAAEGVSIAFRPSADLAIVGAIVSVCLRELPQAGKRHEQILSVP